MPFSFVKRDKSTGFSFLEKTEQPKMFSREWWTQEPGFREWIYNLAQSTPATIYGLLDIPKPGEFGIEQGKRIAEQERERTIREILQPETQGQVMLSRPWEAAEQVPFAGLIPRTIRDPKGTWYDYPAPAMTEATMLMLPLMLRGGAARGAAKPTPPAEAPGFRGFAEVGPEVPGAPRASWRGGMPVERPLLPSPEQVSAPLPKVEPPKPQVQIRNVAEFQRRLAGLEKEVFSDLQAKYGQKAAVTEAQLMRSLETPGPQQKMFAETFSRLLETPEGRAVLRERYGKSLSTKIANKLTEYKRPTGIPGLTQRFVAQTPVELWQRIRPKEPTPQWIKNSRKHINETVDPTKPISESTARNLIESTSNVPIEEVAANPNTSWMTKHVRQFGDWFRIPFWRFGSKEVGTPIAEALNKIRTYQEHLRRFLKVQRKEYSPAEIEIINEIRGTEPTQRKPQVMERYGKLSAERRAAVDRGLTEYQKITNELAEIQGLEAGRTLEYYVPHIWEWIKQYLEGAHVPEDFANAFNPRRGGIRQPFLEQRLGMPGYIEDPYLALETYARYALKKAYLEPALKQIDPHRVRLEQADPLKGAELNRFIKDELLGIAGEARLEAADAVRGWLYGATLGGNIMASLINLTQIINIASHHATRPIATARGAMRSALQLMGQDPAGKLAYEKAIFGRTPHIGKLDFFGGIEYLLKQIAYNSETTPAKGINTAFETQFGMSQIFRPKIFRRHPVTKALGMFMSYPWNQFELIGQWIRRGNVQALSTYLALNYALGGPRAFMPEFVEGAIVDALPREKKRQFLDSMGRLEKYSLAGATGVNIAPRFGFGIFPSLSPFVTSAVRGVPRGIQVAKGERAPEEWALRDVLPYSVPGGTQVSKVIRAARNLQRGYTVSTRGEKLMPADVGTELRRGFLTSPREETELYRRWGMARDYRRDYSKTQNDIKEYYYQARHAANELEKRRLRARAEEVRQQWNRDAPAAWKIKKPTRADVDDYAEKVEAYKIDRSLGASSPARERALRDMFGIPSP